MTRAYQDPHQNLIKSAIIIVVQDTRRLDLILHPNPLLLIHDPQQLIRKNSGRWKMMWISVQGIKERPPLDGFLLLKLQKEKLTSLKERDGYRVSDRRCLILEPLQIITGLPILQRCLLHPTLQIQTFKDLVFVVNSVFDEKLRTVFEILFWAKLFVRKSSSDQLPCNRYGTLNFNEIMKLLSAIASKFFLIKTFWQFCKVKRF